MREGADGPVIRGLLDCGFGVLIADVNLGDPLDFATALLPVSAQNAQRVVVQT